MRTLFLFLALSAAIPSARAEHAKVPDSGSQPHTPNFTASEIDAALSGLAAPTNLERRKAFRFLKEALFGPQGMDVLKAVMATRDSTKDSEVRHLTGELIDKVGVNFEDLVRRIRLEITASADMNASAQLFDKIREQREWQNFRDVAILQHIDEIVEKDFSKSLELARLSAVKLFKGLGFTLDKFERADGGRLILKFSSKEKAYSFDWTPNLMRLDVASEAHIDLKKLLTPLQIAAHRIPDDAPQFKFPVDGISLRAAEKTYFVTPQKEDLAGAIEKYLAERFPEKAVPVSETVTRELRIRSMVKPEPMFN